MYDKRKLERVRAFTAQANEPMRLSHTEIINQCIERAETLKRESEARIAESNSKLLAAMQQTETAIQLERWKGMQNDSSWWIEPQKGEDIERRARDVLKEAEHELQQTRYKEELEDPELYEYSWFEAIFLLLIFSGLISAVVVTIFRVFS